MKSSGPRIVVIGLELGDGKLIEGWARRGKLPYLASLMQRGCFGWLQTTAEQLHISAWPTIYTGVAPGEHGVYFTFQPAPGVQGYRRFHAGLYGKPTFWKLLDEAGLRTAVIDAPYTHPEEGYKGQFIYDWGTWAHYLAPGSQPASLLKSLESAVGRYPLGLEANDLGLEPLEATQISAKLEQAIEAKTRATKWLLSQDTADVVVSVFGETHVAGHYCWPQGAMSEEQVMDYAPMLSVYEALDRAIRDIHQAAGAECQLIVVSGDRVGPNYAGCHLLPDILTSLGFLARPGAAGQAESQPASSGGFDPVKVVRDLMPVALRKWIARQMPTSMRDKLAQRVDTADIDWSRTRAYWLPTDLEGCIRINLQGREPQGVVKRGEEYEAVLAELTRELLALRDPDDAGYAIVSEVLRTDQHFPGARRDWLPDLIVRWNGRRPIAGAQSERIGILRQATPDSRPGTHLGPGFLLAAGPGTAVGEIPADANILDVAPTILARCGIGKPAYMPGRVLVQLIQGS
jgi:predicted AlkP superfamily phosphohydrolase/phosphomutase